MAKFTGWMKQPVSDLIQASLELEFSKGHQTGFKPSLHHFAFSVKITKRQSSKMTIYSPEGCLQSPRAP